MGAWPLDGLGWLQRAALVLAPSAHSFTKLRKILADGIYAGALVEWVRNFRRRQRIDQEIANRTDKLKGFVVLPRRWGVERAFAWLSFHRRLSKDTQAKVLRDKDYGASNHFGSMATL